MTIRMSENGKSPIFRSKVLRQQFQQNEDKVKFKNHHIQQPNIFRSVEMQALFQNQKQGISSIYQQPTTKESGTRRNREDLPKHGSFRLEKVKQNIHDDIETDFAELIRCKATEVGEHSSDEDDGDEEDYDSDIPKYTPGKMGKEERLARKGMNPDEKSEMTRQRYLLEVEGIQFQEVKNNETLPENIIYYRMMSVKATTFNSYSSHWKALRKNRCSVSYAGVTKYLVNCSDEKSNGTLGPMMSAVVFYKRAYGFDTDVRVLADMVKEGRTRMKENKTPPRRGGITREHLLAMLKLKEIPQEYKNYFTLLQATGVRGNQLAKMSVLNIKEATPRIPGEGKTYMVTVGRNHKGRCRGKREEHETHETDQLWGNEMERLVKEAWSRYRKTGNPLMAPDWKANRGNQYVKMASLKLKWSNLLVWVVHGFRHGAAIDAFMAQTEEEIRIRLARVATRTGHKSVQCSTHYSLPNAVRMIEETFRKTNAEANAKWIWKQ